MTTNWLHSRLQSSAVETLSESTIYIAIADHGNEVGIGTGPSGSAGNVRCLLSCIHSLFSVSILDAKRTTRG